MTVSTELRSCLEDAGLGKIEDGEAERIEGKDHAEVKKEVTNCQVVVALYIHLTVKTDVVPFARQTDHVPRPTPDRLVKHTCGQVKL